MTKKRLKIAFIVFLVLGILTLINRITYLVIYIFLGLYSASVLPLNKTSIIIAVNNNITNIWYIWLVIAGILYWLYRKQPKNLKNKN